VHQAVAMLSPTNTTSTATATASLGFFYFYAIFAIIMLTGMVMPNTRIGVIRDNFGIAGANPQAKN